MGYAELTPIPPPPGVTPNGYPVTPPPPLPPSPSHIPAPMATCTGGDAARTACHIAQVNQRLFHVERYLVGVNDRQAAVPMAFLNALPVVSGLIIFGLGFMLGSAVYRL